MLYASRQEPRSFSSIYRHPNPLLRPAQRMSRPLVIRLAAAGHRAPDRVAHEDLAALPACLDTIDAWIQEGPLNGPELNAADYQIAPNISLLRRFEQLAPLVEGRPARRLAERVAPDFPGDVRAVLPPQWLAPTNSASSAPRRSARTGSDDALRAIADDEQQIRSVLRQTHG